MSHQANENDTQDLTVEEALRKATSETFFDKSPIGFSREEKQQAAWFDSIRKRTIQKIEAQTFEPTLYMLVLDSFARHESESRGGDACKMIQVKIKSFVDRKKPLHTFRDLVVALRQRYHVFAGVVVAPAWTSARENGIDKDSQLIFLGESVNRRQFVIIDTSKTDEGNKVTGMKVMPNFDGEAWDRFRGMVFFQPAKKSLDEET